MINICKKLWDKRIIRFLIIGSFNFILDVGILNVLSLVFGLPTLIANTVSVTTAITVSYFLNHRIVFRHPQKYSLKGYAKFFAVTGFSAIVIQDVIIDVIAPRVVKIRTGQTVKILSHSVPAHTVELNGAKIVAVAVGLVWNFLLYKYIVFRHDDDAEGIEGLLVA